MNNSVSADAFSEIRSRLAHRLNVVPPWLANGNTGALRPAPFDQPPLEATRCRGLLYLLLSLLCCFGFHAGVRGQEPGNVPPITPSPRDPAWVAQRGPGGPHGDSYHQIVLDALTKEIYHLKEQVRDLSAQINSAAKDANVNAGLIDGLTKQVNRLEDKINSLPSQPGAREPNNAGPDGAKFERQIAELKQDIENLSRRMAGISSPPSTTNPPNAAAPNYSLNIAWTLIAGFLVMFMQAGFALVETGFVRKKNAAHTMAMNLMVYCLAMLGYWACGFAFQMGGIGAEITDPAKNIHPLGPAIYGSLNVEIGASPGWGLIGAAGFFLHGSQFLSGSVLTLFLFSMVFMDTAATIPTGTMAERWKFIPFSLYAVAVGAFIYPVYANWVWGGGWLADLGRTLKLGHGVVDFAGSSVVHLCGGTIAYMGARELGPRKDKYDDKGNPVEMPKHNIPMGVLGTLILAFGWFGFNAGSTLEVKDQIGIIAANTMLASAAGAVTMLVVTSLLWNKPSILYMCNGMLGGLVAITAPCAFVGPSTAVLIGTIAALVLMASATIIEGAWKQGRIDDPVGAVSVHGACGLWGILALGIFANGEYGNNWNGVAGNVRGLLTGDPSQFLAQIIGASACVLVTAILAKITFGLIKLVAGTHRPTFQEETAGLDKSELGVDDAYDSAR